MSILHSWSPLDGAGQEVETMEAALFDSSYATRHSTREVASQRRGRPPIAPRPQGQGTAPLTVAVGHSSVLVAAGLAAMLERMPGCDVRLHSIPTTYTPQRAAPPQVVFGDAASLRRFREESSPPRATRPKLVLVVAGNDCAEQAQVAEHIDDCVTLECGEDELFATVHKLVEAATPSGTPAAEAKPNDRPARPRGGLAPGALRRVRDYVEQHLCDSMPTDALARIARLSLGHFNRAFRQSTGMSPHRYIMHRRVAAAADLLEKTGRALADIALDVGFADQSHFSRTFVAVTGETPSACRRRYR